MTGEIDYIWWMGKVPSEQALLISCNLKQKLAVSCVTVAETTALGGGGDSLLIKIKY
jgi:hypothetical protein